MIDKNYQQQIINTLQQGSTGISLPFIIKDLIKSNEIEKNKVLKLWKEYQGDVSILHSERTNIPARPDNRLANDFRGLIVDQITGYMFGNEMIVNLPENSSNNIDVARNIVNEFLDTNFYGMLDSDLETYLAACGYGFRLLYYTSTIDYLGKEKLQVIMKNIRPWEAMVITDGTIDEPQYGLIYYTIDVVENGRSSKRYKVEFYDSANVYYFVENNKGDYINDFTYNEPIQPHGFTGIPLIQFKNNNSCRSDFDKVGNLIDAYDKLMSYGINDSEAYAMAYLIFYGVEPTQEQINLARKTGAFYIPKDSDADANNDIKFLTKEINTQNLEDLATRLNNDIFRFSSTVDFNDKEFASAQSGEARKYKLIGLENKAKIKERLFKYGYQYIFKVAGTFWSKLYNVFIDYSKINFEFIRNLPMDITIADTQSLYSAGLISKETALDKLPITDDTQQELDRIKSENSNTDDNM